MRLTLIALLLAGVAGCDAEPVSEFDAARQAAEQGLAAAQFNLGNMYHDGEGVPESGAEAVKWYRKAAEQGHAEAQCSLGVMYDFGDEVFGDGVPQDYAEAAKWYRKAAEQGNAMAQHNFANMYYAGKGVPKDYPEAYAWYSVAATNGNEYAKKELPEVKAALRPEQLIAAQKRIEELTEQINANKAK